jgi:serpin B
VANKTAQRIENLLQPEAITDRTKVILANAIHLKATWLEKFRRNETLPFYKYGQDNDVQNVSFVVRHDDYLYSDDTDFHTVLVPYSSEELLHFYIILPKERNGLQKVESQLTEAKFRSVKSKLSSEDVDLKFPKFTIRTPTKLKPILSSLGLGDIFDEGADFSRMTTGRLHVSDVVHEAFIKVNENGTEAAAATAVVIGVPLSGIFGPTPAPIRFVADHPFIFAIVHQRTEAILFLGKVNSIEENEN